MDKFTEKMTDGLRRFAMAGVGAVSLTIEKSREIIDQLATRGEATAAGGQAACEDLQKKMNEQLASFTAKLRSDYKKASFDRLLAQCAALSPEQKALLIERLTAEPEEAESACAAEPCCADETECNCTDDTDFPCSDSSCGGCCGDAGCPAESEAVCGGEPEPCADTSCCSEASSEASAPDCACPEPAPADASPHSPEPTGTDGE